MTDTNLGALVDRETADAINGVVERRLARWVADPYVDGVLGLTTRDGQALVVFYVEQDDCEVSADLYDLARS